MTLRLKIGLSWEIYILTYSSTPANIAGLRRPIRAMLPGGGSEAVAIPVGTAPAFPGGGACKQTERSMAKPTPRRRGELSGVSAPLVADGSAPNKAVQTSGTVSPEQSFMAAAAKGWGGWFPAGCLRAGCVDIGQWAQHQGWPKSANLLSVRTSPPSFRPSQSAGDGHHCDALVVSLRVPGLIETTKVADDSLSRLGVSQIILVSGTTDRGFSIQASRVASSHTRPLSRPATNPAE